MIVEMDVSTNQCVGLIEGVGFVSVNALSLQDIKEISDIALSYMDGDMP